MVLRDGLVSLVAVAALLVGCGAGDDNDNNDDGGSGPATSGAGTSTGGMGSGGGATGGGGGTGGGYIYAPPDLTGRAYFGHYLGDYEIHGIDTTTLEPLPGSPLLPGAPTGGMTGIAKHGVLAVTEEGGEAIQVYDATTGGPVMGSPYATGYGPVDVAHDDARDILWVYCIGTVGDPSQSLLTAYDTSSLPYTELPGSPFAIDVAATVIEIDPVSGAVFGMGFFSHWKVSLEGEALMHAAGSPTDLEGTGADLTVDPGARRLYVGERVVAGDQRVHAFDLDSGAAIAGSPLSVPGMALGDFALHPVSGDLFVVDYGSATLHSIQAEPLMLRDSCGSMGCPIPTTETGVTLDHELNKLFIVHVPDLNQPDAGNGFLTAWDVANPAMPIELTTPGARPTLDVYPFTAATL